ncbi:MAG: DUF3795 domain-containing protein [Ruminiclostridium sp.]
MTPCGEFCNGCKKKADSLCKGCIVADGYVPEWKESGRCRVFACAKEHNVQLCGLCAQFPCDKLTEYVHWNPHIVEHQKMLAEQYYEQQGKV